MADGGVSLSLDDYIKVKRKQGDFKTGRKGAKVGLQQQRRGGGRPTPHRGQKKQKPANQAGQKQKGRKVVGSRYFQAPVKRQAKTPRIRNQRFRGIKNPAIVGGFEQNRLQGRHATSRHQNSLQGRITSRGFSQNILKANRNRRVRGNRIVQPALVPRRNGSQFQLNNRLRVQNNIPRQNNKRVMKLVKKRVQRAHRQLARPRLGFAVGRAGKRQMAQPLRSLLDIQSGVRRSRNGFITVHSPAEKKLQRLAIQEKIARARMARNGNQNVDRTRNQNRNRVPTVSRDNAPLRVQVSNEHHRREYYQQNYTRPSQSQVRGYDPYAPSTMYADQEVYGSPPQRSAVTDRARWSPPIVRTATNDHYRTVKPEEKFEQINHRSSLNPEIQRKISFIQSRSRAGAPEIMPDFRGPVASSTVKLGDRFRMYMH